MPTQARRSPVTVVLALLLAGCLGACSPRDPDSMVLAARHAQEQGEPRTAVIMLKGALQKDSTHRGARLLLGEVYLAQADPQAAEQELRRARGLGADAGKVMLLLGKALLMQGRYDQVLSEIGPATAPAQRPAILALRGNALLGQGKVDEARTQFSEALKLSPESAQSLLGLARIAVWEKQTARAHTLLVRALAAHPGEIDCLRYRADLLRAEGQTEQALALQQAILARHPHNAQALVDVANLHIDAGRIGPARSALASARKLTGDSVGLLYAEAMLDFRDNQRAAALEKVQRVLRAAPEHYPSLLLAGALQMTQGAHQEAAAHLQRFLQAYPGHPYASKLLVSIRLAANDPQAAWSLLEPLLGRYPDDLELLSLAGEASLRGGRFDQAAQLFERAASLRPDSAAFRTGLAVSHLGHGDSERAIGELEHANQLARDKPAATGVLLAMSYLRAGQTDKALQVAQEMEQRADNPLVQNLKGGIFLARADARAARISFNKALALYPAYLPALTNLERLDALEQRSADTRPRYLKALEKMPRDSALMEALARLALAQQRVPEALSWIERARAAQPDALPLALRAAQLYLQAGQPDKAFLLAQQLQSLHPGNAAVLGMLGQSAVAARRFAQAMEAYARLAALSPGSGRPHVYLASLHIAQKQDAAALAALDKALTIEPGLLEARITLVNLLLHQGKPAQALAVASALKKSQPGASAGDKLEGDVYSAQGRDKEALGAYQLAFSKQPSGAALIQISGALDRLGRAAEADALAERWFAQHPADVPTRLHVASRKLVGGNPGAAIPHLEAVLQVEPANLSALNDLAWCYQRVGNRQALAIAERAYARAPDSPVVLDTLGWIHLAQGNLARAAPLLKKANALAPHAPEILYHYGMLLAKEGDKRAARSQLQKALASGPGFARRQEAQALLESL
ncbi:XrtA/PEP-CTERM system TPR-repeat protein PrsT [Massilia sp. CF038]|uniref:XrtA/PEP-CTERM system TPR-repeat protein PrsT n=1 Tax=Massilia sp. CF038 TaxID=1881045 RepID=UPI000921908F|nr:XrtA/PEP-CTERM system TPR-repeat protein PrsT [Massilia sp. CF038]SHG75054.1 putative PEP-CTERM system TPR-repeat lipoprotein [Massilia sp. CF038]